jgi:hypothetical protein
MAWLYGGMVVGGILTVVVVYLLAKELYGAIKDSNEGRCSDRCDLD